ncbi:DNA adenine methylase [Undibacterium flavidum]|uniref:site-specific DNA-methyltransferase (adenine-specific) n=1 Tax=Undibacterium flavidum TaxID=2762297 RepID=A0ABR6Y9B1_9BURK|nr:DNA adenine methylase [Undibacterium flavidum]MBC3873164.1 DNA adenine methylase [Undibacterium flavidum]
MYSNRLYSPLRYPGGKSAFAPLVTNLMVENNLVDGHYLEPYAGGAAVALDLLFHGVAKHIHINDYDTAIYDFWISVTRYPEELLKLLKDTPIDMEQWHFWRDVLRGKIEVSQVERGFATLFLNRTNRSGILKAGVIGGKEQAGVYKMDARLNKKVLSDRIARIALNALNISVYCEDALSLLKRCASFLPSKSLIYLDPPYFVKGQGLYRNFYERIDHENIAKLLQSSRFGRKWLVSYDNVEEIKDMYVNTRSLDYGLSYTAQTRYIGSEVMFFSQKLKITDKGLPKPLMAA